MTTTGHWVAPCLLFSLAFAVGCPETVKPPADNDTEGDAMQASSSEGSGSGPQQCPDNPDPECTTSNACGNDEICAACECVPQPSGCKDPLTANCADDDDCVEGQVCVGCTCVDVGGSSTGDVFDTTGGPPETTGDACDCELPDNPCEDPALVCDGCACVACGSGMASPADPIGDVTPEIVVHGTMLTGNVTGDMGACPSSLCVVEIVNDLPEEVFFNAINNSLIDPVFFVPEEGMLPPNSTTVLELSSNACDVTGAIEDTIYFQDPIDFIEYGRVDITIDLSAP